MTLIFVKNDFLEISNRRAPSAPLLLTVPLGDEPQLVSENVGIRGYAGHAASHVPGGREMPRCAPGRVPHRLCRVPSSVRSYHACLKPAASVYRSSTFVGET